MIVHGPSGICSVNIGFTYLSRFLRREPNLSIKKIVFLKLHKKTNWTEPKWTDNDFQNNKLNTITIM